MKNTLSCFAFFLASSALACPVEQYVVHQVALDANGVVTRSEAREVPKKKCRKKKETTWENVVVDRIQLVENDELVLNAAPGMQDASVQVAVRLESQIRDEKGIFSTSYAVREIWTSSWGGQSKSETKSRVTVVSNYAGDGKQNRGCGRVEVHGMEAQR